MTMAQFAQPELPAATATDLVEGLARVVEIDEAGKVWLEPEQTSSCGGCASVSACGSQGNEKGIGTTAS